MMDTRHDDHPLSRVLDGLLPINVSVFIRPTAHGTFIILGEIYADSKGHKDDLFVVGSMHLTADVSGLVSPFYKGANADHILTTPARVRNGVLIAAYDDTQE